MVDDEHISEKALWGSRTGRYFGPKRLITVFGFTQIILRFWKKVLAKQFPMGTEDLKVPLEACIRTYCTNFNGATIGFTSVKALSITFFFFFSKSKILDRCKAILVNSEERVHLYLSFSYSQSRRNLSTETRCRGSYHPCRSMLSKLPSATPSGTSVEVKWIHQRPPSASEGFLALWVDDFYRQKN